MTERTTMEPKARSIAGRYRNTLAGYGRAEPFLSVRLDAVMTVERDNAWSVLFVVYHRSPAFPSSCEEEFAGLASALRRYNELAAQP